MNKEEKFVHVVVVLLDANANQVQKKHVHVVVVLLDANVNHVQKLNLNVQIRHILNPMLKKKLNDHE